MLLITAFIFIIVQIILILNSFNNIQLEKGNTKRVTESSLSYIDPTVLSFLLLGGNKPEKAILVTLLKLNDLGIINIDLTYEDFTLTRTDRGNRELNSHQKLFIEGIFSNSDVIQGKDILELRKDDEGEEVFNSYMGKWFEDIKNSLIDSGLVFGHNNFKLRGFLHLLIGTVSFVASLYLFTLGDIINISISMVLLLLCLINLFLVIKLLGLLPEDGYKEYSHWMKIKDNSEKLLSREVTEYIPNPLLHGIAIDLPFDFLYSHREELPNSIYFKKSKGTEKSLFEEMVKASFISGVKLF